MQRAFVTIGERQVHLRRLGAGPPVLILHQSPKNSAEQEPLMRRVAALGCTAIAPDTPGFGHSDPIAGSDIDSFAHATAELMATLGIARAPVYGFHTGASIATRLAALRPDLVALLIANGTLVLDDAERADFQANYLPAFAPTWDGSHLVWAWQRMRDQTIFFPWHRRTGAARMVRGPSAPEVTHANVMDLFMAGDAYRAGYGAAIGYDARADIPSMSTPAMYLAVETDPLTPGLQSFPALPATARVVRVRTIEESWDVAAEALAAAASGAAPEIARPPERVTGWTSDMVGGVHVRRALTRGVGRPLVLVHDAGSSSAGWAHVADAMVGCRPMVAIDLSGHGRSEPGAPDATLQDVLAAFVLDDADIIASGWSAALVTSPRLTWVPPPPRTLAAGPAQFAPDLATDADGAHLLRAWRFARDGRLYDPWFAPDAAGLIAGDPDLDPARLHRATVDALTARTAMHDLLRDWVPPKPVRTVESAAAALAEAFEGL